MQFKIERGDELVVEVKGRPSRRKKRRSRNSMIRRGGSTDYSPRRLGADGLNFYDLGQILSGASYVTVPLGRIAVASAADFDLAFWDSIKSYYLAVENWSGNFKKISKAEAGKYGISVAINDDVGVGQYTHLTPVEPKLDSAGRYRLSSALERISFQTNGIFFPFDSAALKITSLPSYASPATGLNLRGTIDVFVMPCVYFASSANSVIRNTSSGPGQSVHANSFASVPSRTLLNLSGSGTYNSAFGLDGGSIGATTAATVNALLTALDSSSFASWLNVVAGGGPVTPTTVLLIPPGLSGSVFWLPSVVGTTISLPAGALVAVLRSSSGTRYLWSTSSVDSSGQISAFTT